jgi:chromosome segregation ATPase
LRVPESRTVKNARYIQGIKAQGDARMSVPRQSAPPKDPDLETTAELPVLDVAAYEAAVTEERSGSTDTWHMPALNAQAAAAAASGAAAIAAAEDRSLQLETDLRALAENLRDVEERLTRRGERLIELERELANSRAERIALDQRTATLVSEAEARASAAIRDAEERAKAQTSAVETLAKSQIAAAEERAAAAVSAADERTASLVTAAEARATTAAADLAAARAELATAQSRAAALEASLAEHAGNIRTLQSGTHEQASLLATRERELDASRKEFFALETRTTQYLEALHSLEGRRNIFDEQLLGLESELGVRDTQIADLQKQLVAQTQRAQSLENDLAARTKRVESLEREVTALAGTLGQRNVEVEQSGRNTSKLQESVSSLTETLAARVEKIKSLEAAAAAQSEAFAERGKQIETLTREREKQAESAAREREALAAKIAGLETALAGAKADIAARDTAAAASTQTHAALQATLVTTQARVEQLERDLAVLRGETSERAANMQRLEEERDEQINRFASAEARAVELEQRIADNAEVIGQLQEELRATLLRGTELEGDLHAAEDAINRLETELRNKSTKLEELTRTQEEWRTTIDDARHSLAERDSMIHRLETEAANSALLLGNIQQSMRKYDTAQSGSHEIAPEGAVRLLIRVDGDSEVVHVLGRKTTVGRTPDNDLQIDAKFISRNHAVILAGPNHTIIEDLNSTNGVAVNGKRITRHTLRDGDSLAIGKTTFRFAVRPPKESRG